MKRIILLLAAASPVSAVEIRVATFNIGAHFGETFFDYSLGDQGTPDHETVRMVLQRIDADVVALQEIHPADLPGDLNDLATTLGYPYSHVAPVSAAPPLAAPIDTSLRVAFLSRHPFVNAGVIRSPAGAKELTRLHPVVKVDMPGTTRDPVVISAHLKAGTTTADRFRRAVEMRRLVGYLASEGLTGDDNFVILGDFNPSSTNITFPNPASIPSGIPPAFVLGADIAFPVSYSTNVLAYFSSPAAVRLDPRQLNGSASTFGTASPGGPTLDLIVVSPAIAGRVLDAEIYNSALDVSNSSGLPKAGSPLASGTSATASDHYAVFADLELDQDFPNLDLALSAAALNEGLPDGTVTATVTLPATRPSAVTVTISSDDAAATPLSPTVVIPAGSLSGSVAIRAPRNFIADPPRDVTFTVSASGYDSHSSLLRLNDVDGPYTFTASGLTVTESFSGFAGDHDPAPWVATGGFPWRGIDSGSSNNPGLRAYGSAADPSLGFLPQGAGMVASAIFVNQTGSLLTSLQIAFDVEQWRSAPGGTADTLSAELFFNGQTIPLPELSHAASQSLPSGAIAGGLTTAKSTTVSGLSIPPDATFELRVTFTPGSGGGVAPADVFVNEFHYDDEGADGNEFIEIAVAPGFTGGPADIDVIPYNGATSSAAAPYSIPPHGMAISLAAFATGDLVNGYQLYSLTTGVDGIQNGGNDGFAIIDKRTGQVLQLISYEGTFTAAPGTPAAGMTSVSVGVSESNSTPENSSLGLTGSGGVPGDFTWSVSSGSNTKGSANTGQTFVVPTLPSQGLAIDNLSVTAIADADFDGDGQSDADEIAFGTDPFDAASIFRPSITRDNGLKLTFPGAAGITYAVDFSTDLEDWDELSTHSGTGQPVIVTLPEAEPAMFFRVRAGE